MSDYDALQIGALIDEPATPAEARAFLINNKGLRYDPEVVDAFSKVLDAQPVQDTLIRELKLTSDGLREGMVLARDLVNSDGMLLLTKGHNLTETMIMKIRRFEKDTGKSLVIHVESK